MTKPNLSELGFLAIPFTRTLDQVDANDVHQGCGGCMDKGALRAARDFAVYEKTDGHDEKALSNLQREVNAFINKQVEGYATQHFLTDTMQATGLKLLLAHGYMVDQVDQIGQRNNIPMRLAYLATIQRLLNWNTLGGTYQRAYMEGYLEGPDDPRARDAATLVKENSDNPQPINQLIHIVEEHGADQDLGGRDNPIAKLLDSGYSPSQIADKLEELVNRLGIKDPKVLGRLADVRKIADVIDSRGGNDEDGDPDVGVANMQARTVMFDEKSGMIEVDDNGNDDDVADAVVEGLRKQLPPELAAKLTPQMLKEAIAQSRNGSGMMVIKLGK